MFGYLDRNRDDGLEAKELPAMLRRVGETQVGALDKDGKGRLDVAELNAALGPLIRPFPFWVALADSCRYMTSPQHRS
jgi:hypothetical protein